MSDSTTPSPSGSTDEPGASYRGPRGGNLFDRVFPGPAPTDPRVAARLEALSRVAEKRSERQRQRPPRGSTPQEGGHPPATAEDIEKLVDAMHEQSDVLRSLLDADIAIRDDARATAQNSRTFAIAGIVIAFFTMIAAVAPLVVALSE